MERMLVTLDEAGESLTVSRSMIYKLLNSGELVSAKIGRRSLVTAESVREYAARVSGEGIPAGSR